MLFSISLSSQLVSRKQSMMLFPYLEKKGLFLQPISLQIPTTPEDLATWCCMIKAFHPTPNTR